MPWSEICTRHQADWTLTNQATVQGCAPAGLQGSIDRKARAPQGRQVQDLRILRGAHAAQLDSSDETQPHVQGRAAEAAHSLTPAPNNSECSSLTWPRLETRH